MAEQFPNVNFIDASKWDALPWYSSGGTRAKRVLLSPDGTEWYFKCSERKAAKDDKPEKYYIYEFWSEIIAYHIGTSLGINVLRYEPAINQNEIGCISPKMIDSEKEQLTEVGRFMVAINPDFLPEDYQKRNQYTFQLLGQTITHFKLKKYWPDFFKTMLFDAIIGNTDRHQENWAFICTTLKIPFFKSLSSLDRNDMIKITSIINKIYKWLHVPIITYRNPSLNLPLSVAFNNSIEKMAPIYDNGSSLARELSDEGVNQLLKNESKLLDYISRGKSEVHWDGEKLNHFSFIEKLVNSSFKNKLVASSDFLKNWDERKISDIVNNIDKNVPEEWQSYCIPEARKKLIIKLLTLRYKELNDLLTIATTLK